MQRIQESAQRLEVLELLMGALALASLQITKLCYLSLHTLYCARPHVPFFVDYVSLIPDRLLLACRAFQHTSAVFLLASRGLSLS